MQACSDWKYNMVSSVVKPAQDNYSNAMPTKIDSPSTANQVEHSKITNGKVSPSCSPQRVTRSRVRCQKEQKLATKTQGASSNDAVSTTTHERLVCPELAINYANTVISSRLNTLGSKQAELESKLVKLSGRVRQKQLQLANSHARKQLDFHSQSKSSKQQDSSTLSVTDVSDMEIDVTKPLPIQVDGASEECSIKTELKTSSPKLEDSLSSLESSFQEESIWPQIEGRLEFGRQLLDEDATDYSSDEETDLEHPVSNQKCENLKKEWERMRTLIGSKWAWLERRISELNKQICHLDYKIQKRPPKESSTFVAPHSTSTPYLALPNGSALLEQIQRSSSNRTSNGVNKHFLPQLLLPGGISSAKLQVKDLLATSSLGKNISLLVEESNEGCARTRPLERQAKRKVIRKPSIQGQSKKEGIASVNPFYHPKLSLPQELPSRLLLDAPIRQILREHSYARQPLSKRRKAAGSLAHISTPRSLSKTELSSSPSPLATPTSASSAISKVNSRRKMYQLTHQSLPLDMIGPASPPVFPRVDTPTQPPLKKKKALPSTPAYDIDNIVIPYSMAASTRLEKLEYKEIITPRWREVEKNHTTTSPGFRVQPVDPLQETTPTESMLGVSSEDEDTSDQSFLQRHEKCEQQEKKRFLNFISGGQRKRSRPSSSSNTPDPLSLSSPLPYTRKKECESPLPSEAELCASQYMGILPWQPREFPLSEKDLNALTNPLPPPHIVRGLISPQHFPESQFKSRTPSIASALATPLSSPISTPSEETPSMSPTEWMVVSTNLNSDKVFSGEPFCKPTNGSHIVLKLTKRA